MGKTIGLELKRFFKDNIKKMIIGATVFSIGYTLLFSIIGSVFPRNNEISDTEIESDTVEIAYFQFYIENQDGSPFTNTTLLEDYFLLPDVISEVELATNIEISDLLISQRESGFVKTNEDRGFLGVQRGEYSNVFSLIAKVGTEGENLEIINHYYDRVINDEISFLENKNVYTFVEPTVLDPLEDEVNLESGTNNMENPEEKLWIHIAVGFSLGLILMVISLFLKTMISKEMSYSFSYNWDEKDLFFLYDKELNNMDELHHLLKYPAYANKLFVSQQNISSFLESNKITNDHIVGDLSDADPQIIYQEVILFIKSGKTTRNWYEKQRRMLKNFNSEIKVIQINK